MAGDGYLQPIIITVHGTGDAERGPEGDEKWWERESAFSQRLLDLLTVGNRKPSLEAFEWSGLNSERARRAAAVELLRLIEHRSRQGQPLHLIGHSHGGSVIAEALFLAAEKGLDLPSLQTWTTVGAPFIEHRPSLSLDGFLQWTGFYAGWSSTIIDTDPTPREYKAIYTLCFALGIPIALSFWPPTAPLTPYLFAAVALAAIIMFVRRPRRRGTDEVCARAAVFAQRGHFLWAETDEAISGLNAAKAARFDIFKSAAPFGYLHRNWWSFMIHTGISFALLAALFTRNLDLLAQLLVIAGLGYIGAYFLDPLLRHTVLKWLDDVVAGRVRERAFGHDIRGEHIVAVSHAPFYATSTWAALPREFSDEIHATVDGAAVKTVSKVRSALGAAYLSGTGQEVLANLPSQLSWDELVHTSYFGNDRLIKLIAVIIIPSMPTPEPEWVFTDPDCATVSRWRAQCCGREA